MKTWVSAWVLPPRTGTDRFGPDEQTEECYLRSSPAESQTLRYLSTYFSVAVVWVTLFTIMQQKHISKQFWKYSGSPRRLQMLLWFTPILLYWVLHSKYTAGFPQRRQRQGWIFYFKKAATGVISHWISCLPARLPPSTKRTLSLASLPDSCSCCVLAVPRIQSVSRKKSHIILFISPGWKSLILGAFLKSCFFLRDKSEPSSLKAQFSELQRKLPQFDSVSPLPSLAVVSSVASSPACLLHFLSLLSYVQTTNLSHACYPSAVLCISPHSLAHLHVHSAAAKRLTRLCNSGWLTAAPPFC